MSVSTALPALRQDLSLHPGAAADDGSPSWVLHDPAANRFYQLGWPAFEILSRWHLGSASAILEAVTAETTLSLHDDDITGLVNFLAQHHLLQGGHAQHSELLLSIARRSRLGHSAWLLKHYLFFRVPLLRPMPLLQRLAPAFSVVFNGYFWWLMSGLLLLGMFLVSRRWDEFTHTFSSYSGTGAMLGIGLSLTFAKILHELGHALTAQRFGCRVPTMGVAFLVMIPMLYTDTNEAWKLRSRRQRLLIGAAGMLAELTLAIVATLLWSFLDNGPLRAGAFMLATTTWIATLAINASPFMRFDGYFLLSDWLNMPNLHGRAFAFGRAFLRRHLLGLDDPPPEVLPASRQRFLVGFAIATWLYRLIVFLGIALLVYHLFFKALGLILLTVELLVFIVRPVWSEIAHCWKRRAELRWCRQTVQSLGVLLLLLLLVAVPWQRALVAPAILGASAAQAMYAPANARVVKLHVSSGQSVVAGQLLLELKSPQLEQQLRLAVAQAAGLHWRIEQQPFNAALLAEGATLEKEWKTAQQRVEGLRRELALLQFRAPFAGRITDMDENLQSGAVVAAGERLLHIVSLQGARGEAFVDEQALPLLARGYRAVFVASRPEQATVRCQIGDVDRLTITTLDQPALASSFGGPIATQRKDNGLIPVQATFRVRLDHCSDMPSPAQELSGVVRLQGDQPSLLQRGWKHGMALLRSEANL